MDADERFQADLDEAMAGFRAMLDRSKQAAKRAPADVIAEDEARPVPDAQFDDALWLALCGYVDAALDLSGLPATVRAYYATRMVDWEVGNGGFSQARHNIPEMFPEAAAGYELMGRPDLAGVIRAALAASNENELDLLDRRLGENDTVRVQFVRDHRDDFRLE